MDFESFRHMFSNVTACFGWDAFILLRFNFLFLVVLHRCIIIEIVHFLGMNKIENRLVIWLTYVIILCLQYTELVYLFNISWT